MIYLLSITNAVCKKSPFHGFYFVAVESFSAVISGRVISDFL